MTTGAATQSEFAVLAAYDLKNLMDEHAQTTREVAAMTKRLLALDAKIAQVHADMNISMLLAIDSSAPPTAAFVLAACAKDSQLLDNPVVMRFLTDCASRDLYSLLINLCHAGFGNNAGDHLSDAMPMLNGDKTAIVAQVQHDGRDFVITTGMTKAFVLPRAIGDMIAGIDSVFAAPFSTLAGRRDKKSTKPNVEYMERIYALQNTMSEEIETIEGLTNTSHHNFAPDMALLTGGESLTRLDTGFARPLLPDNVNMTYSNVINIRVLRHVAGVFEMTPIVFVKLACGDEHWYTSVFATKPHTIALTTRFVKTAVVHAKKSPFCIVEPYSGLPF